MFYEISVDFPSFLLVSTLGIKGKGNFYSCLFSIPVYCVVLIQKIKQTSLSAAFDVFFLPSAEMAPMSENAHIRRYVSILSYPPSRNFRQKKKKGKNAPLYILQASSRNQRTHGRIPRFISKRIPHLNMFRHYLL